MEEKEYKMPAAPSVAVEAVPDRKKKEKRPGETRDAVFGAVMALLSVILVNGLIFKGIGLGTAFCLIAMFVSTVVYIGKPKKMGVYSAVCGIAVLALSAGLVFSDPGLYAFTAFCGAVFVFDVFFIETADVRKYPGGTVRSFRDLMSYWFAMTFGKLESGFYGLFHKKGEGEKGSRKVFSVLIGVVIAIPVLLVVVPLLVSSDAAFEALIDRIPDIKVGEIIVSLIFGLPVAMLLFSRQFAISGGDLPEKKEAKERGGIDPTVVMTTLTVISLAYVLYLVSQLAYFFNAFSGLLGEGYTVAQYARRGFFEMSAVCAVNLAVVFFGLWLCKNKKNSENKPLAVRMLSLFLCVFSLLLDATAMSKMVLYIKSFGMTRLRIVTSLFMIFLAVVFLAVTVRIFVKKTPYVKIAVCAAAVICAVTCYTGVDRVIADYNVNAYLDGRLSSVDTETINYLESYSTVPALLKLAKCDNRQLSNDAKAALNNKYYLAFAEYKEKEDGTTVVVMNTDKFDLRAYKYFEYRGRELLKENKDLFYSTTYCAYPVEE